MKLLLIAVAVLHLALGASIVDVMCPDSCTCQVKDEHLETSCVSYEFIKKLIPKQVSTIVRLNINNASLVNIDSKLKYLKNLHSLDLSNNAVASLPSQFPYLPKLKNLNLTNNHLGYVSFSQLPPNLQVLDLSKNSIENFPKDWTALKQLKTLHFHDNPIQCDCDNLSIYEQLARGVEIPEVPICNYPKEFHGRPVNTVNCSLIRENLLNSMLGDEPGSGMEEFGEFEDHPSLIDDQEEFINAEEVTTYKAEEDLNEEGSGEEGSGDLIPILPIYSSPKACHFNCSTPRPVGVNDETDASPPPNEKEQVRIVLEDIFQFDSTTPTTEPATHPATEPTLPAKEEPIYVKESDKSEVETFPTNDTVLGEMERASFENSSNHSVYIIVALLVAFVVFIAIYYVNKRRNQKRRNQRKRNKSNENGFGEEMKPLGKSTENAKPVEQINSKVPETAPLLNGQNGKVNEDKPEPVDDQNKEEEEEIELRKNDIRDSLTPQPERVTIRASEISDSIPKTPQFVHRQLNSDGEFVTTEINSN
jgi:hypothetical protein